MRRHTAIPVKTSAVAVLIMTGAVYMAAEARQAVIRKQQREISRIENSLFTPSLLTPSSLTPPSSRPQIVESIASVPGVADVPAIASRPQSAEVAAERQAARIPAQMPASANDSHRRQIVISIRDRRLALLEDGKLVKSYPIAVGARVSPSPDGEFAVINHARNPTYRHAGKEILPGKDNPTGHALDRPEPERLRHSRHQCSQLHRQGRITRLLPHGSGRRGGPLQPGTSWGHRYGSSRTR